MKFSVDPKLLEPSVRLVSGVVDSRPIRPQLANLLAEADGNRLSFTGTDLEVEASACIEVPGLSADKPVRFTVAAKRLSDALGMLGRQDSVDFEVSSGRVVLKSDTSTYRFSSMPEDGIQLFESGARPKVSFSIPTDSLLDLLKGTAFAVAHKDARHFLNGMLFEVTPFYFRVVGTDGHRLAQCTLAESTVNTGTAENLQAIVPRKAVIEMVRFLEYSHGDHKVATLSIGEHLAVLEVADMKLRSKLIEGPYPKYERVIPKQRDSVLTCNRNHLKEACRRASVLFNEGHGGIHMNLESDKKLSFSSKNAMEETADIKFEGKYKGEPINIAFKAAYLQDVMSALQGDEICFKLQDSSSSVLIEDPALVGNTKREDVLYVIMPLRV